MRIAVINWSSRKVGGAESYLAAFIPALANTGHTVSLWYETDEPAGRELIHASDAFALTLESLPNLRAWAPDLLYCHGLEDPTLEARLLEIAPAVFFAHNYYGTCISGAKTWSFPVVRPCGRRFGVACLVHFYPHRCGGLNPLAMARDYTRQKARLGLLGRYRAIVTHSRHMKEEYLRNGFPRERVHSVAFPASEGRTGQAGQAGPFAALRASSRDTTRLVFIGRMDRLKGGRFLLDALPRVRRALTGRLEVTFAGDGPERADWEQHAARLVADDPTITIRFAGWLNREALDELLDRSDLLVFPSVWPEPFGLAGLEAGLRGVPAAAFATGGIPDWLSDGVNGFTAPGNPPHAVGLAEAIVRCLEDPATYARLRQGAVQVARRFSMAAHLRDLGAVFERVTA